MSRFMYEGAYRYRRYRKPLGKKKYFLIAAVLAAAILFFISFQKRSAKLLLSLGEENARAVAAQSLNDAAMQAMQWNAADYTSFVIVTRDGEGNILSMQADAQKINLLARQTVALTMANLNAACEEGVGIPLGAFSGIELLAGAGPDINFSLIPVGNASCSFRSSFTGAGLNQSLHSVYMDVTAQVSLVMPSGTSTVSAETEILVCESVIVGKIPEVYFQGGIAGL